MLKFYYGPDIYRIRQAIAQEHSEGTSMSSFSMTSANDRDEFQRQLKYPSFFQETRVLVIYDALASAEVAQQTLDIFEHFDIPNLTDIHAIVVGPEKDPRPSAASKKLNQYLTKKAAAIEYAYLIGPARTAWVSQFCAERGCPIMPAALGPLLQCLGQDSWSMANELEKICAYANNQPIVSDMLAIVSPRMTQQDPFGLSDALLSSNKRLAIQSLWQSREEGVADQLLLGTVASALRTLIAVGELASQHLAPNAIAKIAGIHPFVAGKALRASSSYDGKKLLAAHHALALLDQESKNGLSDIGDGLFSVVLEL